MAEERSVGFLSKHVWGSRLRPDVGYGYTKALPQSRLSFL